jgi:hypothetical protein
MVLLLDWLQLYIEFCPVCSLILGPIMCLPVGENICLKEMKKEEKQDTYFFVVSEQVPSIEWIPPCPLIPLAVF